MQPTGNAILDALPPDEYGRLAADLQPHELSLREILTDAGEPVSHVHFPRSGVVSLIATTREGQTLEVTMVGPESAAGLTALTNTGPSVWRMLVQVPGSSLAMPVDALQQHIRQNPRFLESLVRFSARLLELTSQGSVCNRFHNTQQRLAVWLLCMHDRVEGDELTVTHDIAAAMLGVHRPSATVAMQQLEQAGAVARMARGHIGIVDRQALETAACDCYAAVQQPARRNRRPAASLLTSSSFSRFQSPCA